NSPLGCPIPLSPGTLHDHRRPPHSHQTLPHALWPRQTCAYDFNPAPNPISDPSPTPLCETSALSIPANLLPPAFITGTYSIDFSAPTTPEPHSKHIIPTGGFAQPVLSPVFRPDAVGPLADQVAGLNTGDRTLVGFR